MRSSRFGLLALLALVAVLVAGCGGGGKSSNKVPSDAVAVVGGEKITKQDFDALLEQARNSFKSQRRPFPKVGTAEYNSLKNQAVAYLVQKIEFRQKAKDLGVKVDDKEVQKRLGDIKKQYFGGNEKRYEQRLKAQGLTKDQVERDVRSQLLSEGLTKEVTKGIKVTDADVADYYNKNKKQYSVPASRDVRHILVSVCGAQKTPGCLPDAKAKALADKLYTQLKGGADFAAVAKRYSQDPGSKTQGGKLTVSKGQTVAPFEKAAFSLGKNELSKPVKTQFGYHLIEPLSELKPASTTPLDKLKSTIRPQLLQSKKSEAMAKWVADTRKGYANKISYGVGYQPPAPTTTASTGSTTAG